MIKKSLEKWGTYETKELKEGVISIDFGYSKQKNEIKNKLKWA